MRVERLKNVLKHPVTEWKVQKAKRKYRKKNPYCVITGRKHSLLNIRRKVDVHHKKPVHVRPDLACDPENLICLLRDLHFVVGHFKNWKDHNPNVLETALSMRLEWQELSGREGDEWKDGVRR